MKTELILNDIVVINGANKPIKFIEKFSVDQFIGEPMNIKDIIPFLPSGFKTDRFTTNDIVIKINNILYKSNNTGLPPTT